MDPCSKAGRRVCRVCSTRAASYSRSSVQGSIGISNKIDRILSATELPPGSRVCVVFLPIFSNKRKRLQISVDLPDPSVPSKLISIPLVFVAIEWGWIADLAQECQQETVMRGWAF